MRSFVLFFAASCLAQVAFAGLAGLTFNSALTAVSREARFDIVTINPTSGQASTTQRQLYALFDGLIDTSNIVIGASEWAFSLQAFDDGQVTGINGYPVNAPVFTTLTGTLDTNPITPASRWAYLARQNLRARGRFEYCQLPATTAPINLFWESDTTVIATSLDTTSTIPFSIVRIQFRIDSTFCQVNILASITTPVIASIAKNVQAQRGNRIFFVAEPSAGFAAAATPLVLSYDINANNAITVHRSLLPTNVWPISITPIADAVIILQGWNGNAISSSSTATIGFVNYEINLNTISASTTVSTLSSRTIVTANEELSFAGTFVNQTNTLYTLKHVATLASSLPVTTSSGNQFTQPWLAAIGIHTTGAGETKAAAALNTFNIFRLFDLANTTFTTFDQEPSDTSAAVSTAGPNRLVLSGANFLAGVENGVGSIVANSVSRCRISFGTTSYDVAAASQAGSNSVLCPLTTGVPAVGGTSVSVAFAADGESFGPAQSFSYNGGIQGARFVQSTYSFRDGTAMQPAREKVTLELLDTNNRKLLYSNQRPTITLGVIPTGAATIRSVTGNTAQALNGNVVFPALAIDADTFDADGFARFTLTATVGSLRFTSTAVVERIARTRGSVAALVYPSTLTATQNFETHLVNPTATASTAALRLGARNLQDITNVATSSLAPGFALGLSTYDRDNKVLNTVEVRSDNSLILTGVSLNGNTANARGTGTCLIPRATTITNDGPSAIWYEGTNSLTLATTFLALIQSQDLTGGSGRRLVRYTRAATSTVLSTCTVALVDLLPVFDLGYGNHQVLLLTNGRLAFITGDYHFTATTTSTTAQRRQTLANSLISVFRYSVAASNGAPAVPGAWLLRNKVVPTQVSSVTQSGRNELAIFGSIATQFGTNGVYLVDISTESTVDTVASIAAGTLHTSASNLNELGIFTSAGTSEVFSNGRNLYAVSVATATANSVMAQLLETVVDNRAATPATAATSTDIASRNYIDFFNIEDPAITAVSVTGTAVTVTANNVILSSAHRCRFSSSAVNTPFVFTPTAVATITTITMANDGQQVNCGTLPAAFATAQNNVYVQLSNDGGSNYGPEGKIGNFVVSVTGSGTQTSGNGAVITQGVVQYEVFGEFTTGAANQAALQTLLSTTVLGQLNALNLGAWSIARSFSTGAVNAASNRTAYTITYQTTASGARLSALQSASAQLNGLNSVLNSNAAAFNALGATFQARQVNSGTAISNNTTSSSLSQGAIAGIVIGCVVGGLLIIALIAYLIWNSGKGSNSNFSQSRNYDARGGSSSSSSSSSDYTGDYSDYSGDYSDYSDYSDYV